MSSASFVFLKMSPCCREWTTMRLHVSCPNRTSARIPSFPHLSSLPVKKKIGSSLELELGQHHTRPNPNRRQRDLDSVPASLEISRQHSLARAGFRPFLHSRDNSTKTTKMAGGKMDIVDNDEHSIKPAPEKASAVPDTTDWPLLLKNYSELAIRTSHFTPIPHGSAPFKRDIKSYVSSGVINLVSLPGEDERANSRWENSSGFSEEGQC